MVSSLHRYACAGMEKLRLGQQQQGHLQGVVKVRRAIEELKAASRKIPPCLTSGCKGDSEAIRRFLQPLRRLLGFPRFQSLKTDLFDKPANTMKARVPLESFRLVSEIFTSGGNSDSRTRHWTNNDSSVLCRMPV